MHRIAIALSLLAVLGSSGSIAQGGKPTIAAVANAASYGDGPVSPGEMVVIFGSSIGPPQLVSFAPDLHGRLASTLAETTVLFDGTPAPLIYVSASQTVAMVPFSVVGNSVSQVQLVYRGVASDLFPKSVASSAPGIFSWDASGKGQGAIANSDGSLNSASNPATPGSNITFYLTGVGQTEPPGSDGDVASGVANVKLPVTVQIAGRAAQLLYGGSAPGNVNGIAQINAVIPVDLQYGGSLPLVVQIGDRKSQSELTVAVAGAPAPAPGAPIGVAATATAANQIDVRWIAADALATRYHVERQTGGTSPFVEVALVAGNTLVFTDASVTPGVTYQYRIRAENDFGFSGYSNTASGSVAVRQLQPPSSLQAVAASQTQVNLTWSNANSYATIFQIERKSGSAGVYSLLATLPNTVTTYQDTSVTPGTAYVYRMRSQGAAGFSGYSNESTVSTPAVPRPSAPVLQAVPVSSSEVHLAWTSTATGVLRFRVERRTAARQYTEILQAGPSTTSFDDGGLIASTAYFYRMQVETGAGMSSYSNEATATTRQGVPVAPTNLRATALSSSQISLTWTNNAPDATAIRVESHTSTVSTFMDIGVAASLTGTGITNNQPNTTYVFRVRAQNGAGYSPYSNEATVTTLSIPKTVFLIHGIGQDSSDMWGLHNSLTGPLGVDRTRFAVNGGFDFGECSDTRFCNANCSISGGAQKLAQHIINTKPPGDIVLIGFSLGGLIARDMIANNWYGVLNGRKVAALITLGAPNAGYPYTLIDSTQYCTPLVQQMDGNWRSQQSEGKAVLSTYLHSLTNQWAAAQYPGNAAVWLAASGRSCSNPYRTINWTTGCRDANPYSDGVVCNDSATYNLSTATAAKPTSLWQDPAQMYVHSSGGLGGGGSALILCGNLGGSNNPPLSDPPPGQLLSTITGVINGLR